MRITELFTPRSAGARPPVMTCIASDPLTRMRRAPHVVSTTRDDLTVLLDLERGQYHTLNEVAGRIWLLLVDSTTRAAITRVIREEYEIPPDAPPDRLERDVTTLLLALDHAGLVMVEPQTPAHG